MKKTILSLSLILLLAGFGVIAKAQASFTATWKFINIVDGYDHNNKCEVYIDGELAGSSSVTLESETNSITVVVAPGSHDFRVVNLAQYEGEWEEHTVANDYSIDCLAEGTRTFGKKNKLFMLFDIDNGTTISWKKMPKAPKAK